MNGGLLICDNSAGLGRLLAAGTVKMGICSDFCRSDIESMQKALFSGSYETAVIFSHYADEELLRLVKEAQTVGTAVFAGLYTSNNELYDLFRKAGAVCCFAMPRPISDICRIILLHWEAHHDPLRQIEVFLEEAGLPRRLSGFSYLAKAVEICVKAPHRLWGGMTDIYEEIAEEYSTKPSLVERSLRNLGDKISKKGALARLTNGRLTQKPTNTELICAVCDVLPWL